MSNSLKSENLTITVPYKGCDKDCKYCISKMTGYTESNLHLMLSNSEKVRTVADGAGITNVLFTGKGEPTLNMEALTVLAHRFKKYPLEIQTNGLSMLKDDTIIKKLSEMKINVVAISLDHKNQLKPFKSVIKKIRDEGMIVRLTFNVSDMLGDLSFDDLLNYCKENGVHQLLLRKLSIPNFNIEDETPIKWIVKHAHYGLYEKMKDRMEYLISEKARLIRILNTGERVYDLNGVSVVSVDYCIQETSEGTDIRSLIFHEDGHLYTTWNSPASIIF